MKIITATEANMSEVYDMLRKPPFDTVVLGEEAQKRIQATFGEELTANQVVDRIVTDVRSLGDAALLDYTFKIDGARFTAKQLEVTEAEFIAAEKLVEPEVLSGLEKAIANVRRYHSEQLPSRG